MTSIREIETESSRPKTSPRKTNTKIVKRILEIRDTHRKNGPQVIHAILEREGIQISFSTVYRILKRTGRIPEKKRKKTYHRSGERPLANAPGILVQMDSIHRMKNPSSYERFYVMTLIDVYSRWAYARASEKISTYVALRTAKAAQAKASFGFSCIQSDHGPEFSQYFTTMLESGGIRHRHSRVRQPNDNAHVERFNRTIQEELKPELLKYRNNMNWLNRSISEYLTYYNDQRLHAGLNHKTPNEML